jgi:hypothetical protein
LTETHQLLAGSPALDAANEPDCPMTDQRGELRPFDGDGDGSATCDIGAYEAQEYLPYCDPPGVPELVTPQDGHATNDDTPTFDWLAAPYSSAYILQVDDQADFSSPELELSTAATVHTPPGSLADGDHYWRVRGHNTTGGCDVLGDWSSPQRSILVDSTLPTGPYYYVDTLGDDLNDCLSPSSACRTVQGAHDKAPTGSAVIVAPGTFTENITIDQDLTLRGFGATDTVIDGGASGPVVDILWNNPNHVVRIVGLTIQNGIQCLYSWCDTEGGGIHNYGDLTLQESAVSGNAANLGGGIWTNHDLVIENSTIASNESRWGGGIYCMGYCQITIDASTFAGNFASDSGGAMVGGGYVQITNTTFSGNHVYNRGGALYTCHDDYYRLTNVTMANNYTSAHLVAGGIFVDDINCAGVIEFANSIIADNSPENCDSYLGGGYASLGHNLDSDGTCGLSATGDLIGLDPYLGPLQDNGGLTFTHALLPGSPAVDSGDNGQCPSVDQCGETRPYDGDGDGASLCDIGAYEAQYETVEMFLPLVIK